MKLQNSNSHVGQGSGLPLDQPLIDVPMDRQIVLLNRQLGEALASAEASNKACAEMRDAINDLCLAIEGLCENPGSEERWIDMGSQMARAISTTGVSSGRNFIHKDEVKPLIETLQWLHAGSICADPASAKGSCPVCEALKLARDKGWL